MMIKSNPTIAISQAGATIEHLQARPALTPGRSNQEATRAPQAVAMPINWSIIPGRRGDR